MLRVLVYFLTRVPATLPATLPPAFMSDSARISNSVYKQLFVVSFSTRKAFMRKLNLRGLEI